jgi:DNA polymerase-1
VFYDAKQVKEIIEVFSQYHVYAFHNAKFDLLALSFLPGVSGVLGRAGVEVHDTLPLSHIYDSSGQHGLKPLSIRYLDLLNDDEQELKKLVIHYRRLAKKDGFPRGPDDAVEEDYWLPGHYGDDSACKKYAVLDVKRTAMLFIIFHEYITEHGLSKIYERERKLIPVLMRMEQAGLALKPRAFKILARKARQAVLKNTAIIIDYAKKYGLPELNPNSPSQMKELVFNKLSLPPLKETKSGKGFSLDADTMKTYRDDICTDAQFSKHLPFIKACIDRSLATKVEGYLANYSHHNIDWVLHPWLNQNGTATTRTSSQNPNGQNISGGKEIRDADGNIIEVLYNLKELFGPRPGKVWYAFDYSQLQLRIFSYVSQEQSLIDAFARGEDFHDYVAREIFDIAEGDKPSKAQRRIAKNCNFGIIFGAGKRKIESTSGVPGIYDEWRSRFPSVDRFMTEVIQTARRDNRIHTTFGYPLTVDSDKAYKGVNYIVQGDEGDIVKNAMIACDEFLQSYNRTLHQAAKMIFCVHDELIFEADAGTQFPWETVKRIMEAQGTALDMVTPVEATIIKTSWAKAEALHA